MRAFFVCGIRLMRTPSSTKRIAFWTAASRPEGVSNPPQRIANQSLRVRKIYYEKQ